MDAAVESSKAQSCFCFSCFLAVGEDNREVSAPEPRTPKPLAENSYRTIERTLLHKQLQHWATKSQRVQDVAGLLFHLSHR